MRRIALASLLCAGCFDYGALSSGAGDAALAAAPDLGDGAPDLSETGDGSLVDGAVPAADGAAGDGLAGPSDMACAPQYTHTNGLGQTWTDCTPLGTYNDTQALRACAASFDPAATCIHPASGADCSGKAIYAYVSAGSWAYFVYSGTYQGKTITSGNCTVANTTTSWN